MVEYTGDRGENKRKAGGDLAGMSESRRVRSTTTDLSHGHTDIQSLSLKSLLRAESWPNEDLRKYKLSRN